MAAFFTSASLVALALFVTLTPLPAAAFWPFSSPAGAAGAHSPLMHDSSLALLDAATNPDPNPIKGGAPVVLSEGAALLAEAGPEGTLADVSESASSGRISLYVVRAGDTLSDIARMFGVSINTIKWANNLGSKSIHPGQQLIILPITGVEHTVVKGDTLASIAKKYHANTEEIVDFNGLDSETSLSLGTILIIPEGEIAAPPPSTTKKKVAGNPYRGGSGSDWGGYYRNPLPGAIVTQGVHGWNGVDLAASRGTPIYAAADGVVIISKNSGWNSGYGNYVVVTHTNGTQTLYAHMSRGAVTMGQAVAQGEVLGYVGNTGKSTGPHLHFEVRGAKNPFAVCRVGIACYP